jgi:hypothetical protein
MAVKFEVVEQELKHKVITMLVKERNQFVAPLLY